MVPLPSQPMTRTGTTTGPTQVSAPALGGTTTDAVTWTVVRTPVPASLDDDDAWAIHGEAALDRI